MVAVNVDSAAVVGGGISEVQTRGYVPVGELGTTPMQQGAIAIIFLAMALALLTWGFRMYSRFSTKQLGMGMCNQHNQHTSPYPKHVIES